MRTSRMSITQLLSTNAAVETLPSPHLEAGASVINTTSVTAYRSSPMLLDYSATKGAIVAFTRSLAMQLVEKKPKRRGNH